MTTKTKPRPPDARVHRCTCGAWLYLTRTATPCPYCGATP